MELPAKKLNGQQNAPIDTMNAIYFLDIDKDNAHT